MYNEGVSRTGSVLDLAVDRELIQKRGAFFRYNDTLLGQGRENSKQFLAENTAMLNELEALIRQDAGLPELPALDE